LLAAGLVSILAWAAVYVLLFSHTLWHSPTLIPDHWPALFYPIEALLPWAWVHAHRDTPAGLANVGIWLALAAVLLGAWGWALRATGRLRTADPWIVREGFRIILVGLLLLSLILVFSPGFTSQDVFSYIWYGKMAGVYGVSPYTHTPLFFAWQDPKGWLQWVYWKNQPSVYGPAWVWPAAALARLAESIDGDIVTYLLTHRFLAAGLHIANTVLVWNLAGKLIPRSPGARLAATVFYGWCPLVVWEFANNAHNDALMVFWILVAVWCHVKGMAQARHEPRRGLRGWWQAAVVALTLAALVKLIAILLIPGYMMLLFRTVDGAHPWRRRVAIGAQAGALALGLSALLYWPQWEGWVTLQPLLTAPGNERYVNSLGDVVRYRGPEIIHWLGVTLNLPGAHTWRVEAIGDSMEAWVRPLFTLTAGAIIGGLSLRVRDFKSLLRNWGWSLVAYLLIGALWFWPWYVTWFAPLAALRGPGRLRTTAILYTIGGMILYGLYPLLAPPFADLEGYVPLICFGPVALYLLGRTLSDLREKVHAWRARRVRLPAGAVPEPVIADS
jgi:4-amino-4-deoxy-L-arabinose transferase-like glycosyltransferase